MWRKPFKEEVTERRSAKAKETVKRHMTEELKEWAHWPANWGLVWWASIGVTEAGFKYTEKDAKE